METDRIVMLHLAIFATAFGAVFAVGLVARIGRTIYLNFALRRLKETF
jgi:hypothetical protein